MDAKALTAFRTVADAGSISGAADRLGVAQSALSARISALEASLGVVLFERLPRGVRLTPAGVRLLPYAARIAELTGEAVAAARGEDDLDERPLRLGAVEVVAASVLAPLLTRFLRSHPGVRVGLTTGVTAELVAAVDRDELDAAIVADNGALGDRHRLTLGTLPLALATARGHDPGGVGQAFGFGDGCVCTARLRGISERHGWTPRDVRIGSVEAIIGAVSAGLGITVLPRQLLEGRDLELTSIPPLALTIVHRPDRWAAAKAIKQSSMATAAEATGGAGRC